MTKKRQKESKKTSNEKQNRKMPGSFVPFIIILVIGATIFFANFFDNPNNFTKYVNINLGWLASVETIIYLLLTAAFGWFGIRYIKKHEFSKNDKIVILSAFILIAIIYILGFNTTLDQSGDNASYVINAKAIKDTGIPRYMNFPDNPPDIVAAPGLPFSLIPAMVIFGIDIPVSFEDVIILKIIPLLYSLGFIIVAWLFFCQITGNRYIASMLMLAMGANPLFVDYSSMIMTEMPFIFWIFASLYAISILNRDSEFKIGKIILASLAIFMTYLTRTVGAFISVAAVAAVFFNYDYKLILRDFKGYLKTPEFKKFITFSLIVFILFFFWIFIRPSLFGLESQASQITGNLKIAQKIADQSIGDKLGSIFSKFTENIELTRVIMIQNIYPLNIKGFLDWQFLQPNMFFGILNLMFLLGLIIHMVRKRSFVDFFVVFTLLVFNIVANSNAPIRRARYLIPFIPFFIYYIYYFLYFICNKFDKKHLGFILTSIFLLSVMLVNFNGATQVVSRNNEPTNPALMSYYEGAQWCGKNLPASSIMGGRKQRILYTFSGLKAPFKTARSYSDAAERNEEFLLNGVEQTNLDYILFSTFTGVSVRLIYPIINKHPDKFVPIKQFGPNNAPAILYQINKWWNADNSINQESEGQDVQE